MSDILPFADRGTRWERPHRGRRRVVIIVLVSVLVLALAAGAAGYLLLRTAGSPQQTAASYLDAWGKGDYPAMNQVSVGKPAGGLAGPLKLAATQLGVRHLHLVLGRVTQSGSSATAGFTATADLALPNFAGCSICVNSSPQPAMTRPAPCWASSARPALPGTSTPKPPGVSA